jgi:exosome complex component CSL4
MENKKLVLPGEHVSSYEEAEPGENCYAEKDDIYSAALGENSIEGGKSVVKVKNRVLEQPHVGMEVYAVIFKASPNNAKCDCMPASEVEGEGRGVVFSAALPVTEVRRGYVPDLRNEVKIGDIIKAKVNKKTQSGLELSIFGVRYGCVKVFCPKCRDEMEQVSEGIFVSKCGWKERRKVPREGPEEEPREERGPRREGGFRSEGGPRYGRGPRREGGPGQEGGRPDRRFERRSGPQSGRTSDRYQRGY